MREAPGVDEERIQPVFSVSGIEKGVQPHKVFALFSLTFKGKPANACLSGKWP